MNFTELLLQWYHENARKLPWRETKDPYAIWVSEVMLQQTQVDTVIPYYHRFLKQFPTLEALATADEAEVMKAWEGLGYYRRARLLHQGVREVQAKYGGTVPEQPKELAALPGVGPYMVGSLSSIAFNRPVAAVDGNVIRVVTRMLALNEDPTLAATRRKITAWVQEHFPPGQAGDYTQALMELGALVCLPKRPRCLRCPVRTLCRSTGENPERYPVKGARVQVPEERRIVMVIDWNGRRLLTRRPENGLMAGFWEYPHFAAAAGEDAEILVKAWSKGHLGQELSFCFVKKMTHVYSHLRWNLEILQAEWKEGIPLTPPASNWFSAEEELKLSRVAFVRKLARNSMKKSSPNNPKMGMS